jgi:hypothetical protein
MNGRGVRAELVPWDDRGFVAAYERAHDTALGEGLAINGPRAAARVQELLRSSGYPHADIDVERTIDEALEHAARWRVWRDGRGSSREA